MPTLSLPSAGLEVPQIRPVPQAEARAHCETRAQACGSHAWVPDWRDIPVFVVNRNRLDALRRLVDWLVEAGTRRVIIMDNASDYPPLIAYYDQLPQQAKVLRLDQNHGPYVLWQQGVHAVLDTPYVVTDSDIVPDADCPRDLVGRLLSQLLRYPDAKKVGMGLRIDNLPQSYGEVETVRKWESQFWEHPVAPGVFAAPIDTTFALYAARAEFSNEGCNLRLGYPYVAEHTPWYVDESALTQEERYYREHTDATFSNWSVARKESWVAKSHRVAQYERRPRVLHLDGGRQYIPGWINVVDQRTDPADIQWDLFATSPRDRLPLPDDTLDGVHLSHVLERFREPRPLLDELYRVAKNGARLWIRVMHAEHAGAWSDASQVRAWYEGSFAFLAQPALPSQPDRYRADWQTERVWLIQPAGEARPTEIVVSLRAIKPARQRAGPRPVAQIQPQVVEDARHDPMFRVV